MAKVNTDTGNYKDSKRKFDTVYLTEHEVFALLFATIIFLSKSGKAELNSARLSRFLKER